MGADQAQEGRRGRQARAALHEARASDHASPPATAAGIPTATRRSQTRSRRPRRCACPRRTSSARSREGSGAGGDAAAIEAVTYEGYGPGGVAILIECLTDNRNRTAADIRHIFTRADASLGEPGSVAWMFEKKGVLLVDAGR